MSIGKAKSLCHDVQNVIKYVIIRELFYSNQENRCDLSMLPLTPEQEARLGLELATKRQEHADLDEAIRLLESSHAADKMMVQRIKKRKLAIRDRIIEIEKIILPEIIA